MKTHRVLTVSEDPETGNIVFPSELQEDVFSFPFFIAPLDTSVDLVFDIVDGDVEKSLRVLMGPTEALVELEGGGLISFTIGDRVIYSGNESEFQGIEYVELMPDPKLLENIFMKKSILFVGHSPQTMGVKSPEFKPKVKK